jgi:hypothetical protein
MREHSGRPRFYENIDVVLAWVDRLGGEDLDTDRKIITLLREMLAIEPSSQATAESISLSIAKFEKGRENKDKGTEFCGDCCSQEHEADSLLESPADDDVWIG